MDALVREGVREGHPEREMYKEKDLHPFLKITALHRKERKSEDTYGTYDSFIEARNKNYPNTKTYIFIEDSGIAMGTFSP